MIKEEATKLKVFICYLKVFIFVYMAVLSIYHELMQFENIGGDLVYRLDQMNLHDQFLPLIEKYGGDCDKFNRVLFYILHVYSKESPLIIDGLDYVTIKNAALDRVGIEEPDLRSDLMNLFDEAVVKTVHNYLSLQLTRLHTHLVSKRELYQQMLNSSMDMITGKDNQVLWDQKRKNSQYADELYREIAEWEQKMAEDTKDLRVALTEVQEKTRKPVLPETIRFETFVKKSKEKDE